MAKRKKRQKEALETELLISVLKALPKWLLVLVICLGICLGVLIETGMVDLSDMQGLLGFEAPHNEEKPAEYLSDKAKRFSVNIIDVGQGDSILILADGKSILIDAGEKEYGAKVVEYAESKGVESLDYIIATHPHSDHIGGMAKAVERFGAKKIIVPRLPDSMVPTTKVYENFLTAVKKKGGKLTAAKAGTVYDICEIDGTPVTMTVLTPVAKASYSDLNDYSVSVRIDYGRISWLFTGDLSKDGENDLINSGADIDVTALKVGHHGSSSASTKEFLDRVTPRMCVISCGKDNSYGHPNKEALERLEAHTNSISRTDISSDISVYSDGEKLYTVKGRKDE